MISMMQYLYRNSRRRAIGIMAATLLGVSFCGAQIRDRTQHQQQTSTDNNQSQINAKKTKRGPRALAVLEFLPGGGARLVPVALWIDDRFYDASLYGANPEPMALQPETVYEATNYGESTGLFTVTTPEQVKGNWVGAGQWKPHRALDDQIAKQAASKPKKAQADNPLNDRPTLKRAGSGGSSSSSSSGSSGDASSSSGTAPSSGSASSSTSSTSPPPSGPSDRPTLKKPSDSSTPPPDSQPQATAASSPSTSSSSASPDENDPNRPVLRRGRAGSSTASASEPYDAAATQPTPATKAGQAQVMPTTTSQLGRRSYPAISDAGQHEMRSLLYPMNSVERTDKTDQMSALALNEVRKFVAKRTTPGLPKTATITDFDLRGYDLEYTNSPTLVFTGKLPVASAKALRGGEFDYFVTVVAREDLNGTPIEIFSSVTDSNHLDAFSRMEIIDAVDADANGRGDLLFRLYSDTGVSYSLYRVYPYEMKKVFEGGSGV